jgi:hypothetical protein
MEEEKWVIAHTASGMTNANIIMGRLKTEDIPARLKYEAAGTIYAVTINGLGKVEILVPASYLEKAREILLQRYDDTDMNWEESR